MCFQDRFPAAVGTGSDPGLSSEPPGREAAAPSLGPAAVRGLAPPSPAPAVCARFPSPAAPRPAHGGPGTRSRDDGQPPGGTGPSALGQPPPRGLRPSGRPARLPSTHRFGRCAPRGGGSVTLDGDTRLVTLEKRGGLERVREAAEAPGRVREGDPDPVYLVARPERPKSSATQPRILSQKGP